jgi:hypothetical protein
LLIPSVFQPPLSTVVDALNPIALVGWSYVAMLVATTPAENLNEAAAPACIALEIICVLEVVRMALVRLYFSCFKPFMSVRIHFKLAASSSHSFQCVSRLFR